MKYTVSIAIDGRVDVVVEADSFEKARDEACTKMCELELGELECIGWHAVNAEAENGVFKDY